jgi:hypothetical protein
MEPLVLRFAAGRVQGKGEDCVGKFVFEGEFSDAGEVRMVKSYIDLHQVLYLGRVDGEGSVLGRWFIPPNSSGPFGLIPEIDVSQLPIAPLGAEPEDGE